MNWDHEGTERWMGDIGDRVEKGTSKRDIEKKPGLLARRTLENLLFDDYLDWIFWLVLCVENSPNEVGSFKEFCDNECLTKEQAKRKKIQSNLVRRKVLKPVPILNESEDKKVNLPALEEDTPLEVEDFRMFDEWQDKQTLEQRRNQEFDFS